MKKNETVLLIAGVGILYLMSRSSSAYGSTVPVAGGGTIPGVGSLVTGISNLFSGLFSSVPPMATPSNPSINPVSSPASYPSTPGATPGFVDSGNPCDPTSVQYNEQICTEMGG